MKNEEVKTTYIAAQKFLAILGSAYGEKLRQEKPELVAIAEDVSKKYQAKYMDIMLGEKPDASALMAEIIDVKNALKLIPTSSYESIKNLDEIITKNSEELQNKLLFDPRLFYNKYAASLVAPSVKELSKQLEENERFNTWFAGSKVVNDNGKPLVVYHGTGGMIEEYNTFKFSPFPAAYFAENKSYSDWFATYRGGKNIMFNCYLRVLNPIDLTPFELEKVPYNDFVIYIKIKYGYDLPENKMLRTMSDKMNGMWAWQYLRNGVDWLKYINQRKEFDGFVYYENNPQDQVNGKENVTKAWMVFNGYQIKTADMRNSTYSLNSNSMTMQKGGEV